MKPLHFNAIVVMVLSLPLATFAQSPNGPLSRAQVLQDLTDLEGVGYRPAQASSLQFPDDIEAAEQRLAVKRRQQKSSNEVLLPALSDSKLDPVRTIGSPGQP